MPQPLVSVLMPAYNHEKYISKAIKSIIDQDYLNIELLIVNDGSKDKTHEKILGLKEDCNKRFLRFVYLNGKNKGIPRTLNKLIDLSYGEYLIFISSDDAAKPNAISTFIDFLEKNPMYALAVGDNEIIDENTSTVFWDENRNIVNSLENAKYKTFSDHLKSNRKDVDFNSDDFGSYISLLKINYIPNGYAIRKKAIIEAGKYKKGFMEDWYMNLQLAKKNKMKYFDEILYSYRWHPENSIKKNDKMFPITLKTFINEKKYCYENGYKELWDTYNYKYYSIPNLSSFPFFYLLNMIFHQKITKHYPEISYNNPLWNSFKYILKKKLHHLSPRFKKNV